MFLYDKVILNAKLQYALLHLFEIRVQDTCFYIYLPVHNRFIYLKKIDTQLQLNKND